MKLFVLRGSYNSDSTFGMVVLEDGTAVAVTVELPWRDNAKGLSRIPAGTYRCTRWDSPKFKIVTWEILAVPGAREKCLLHPANLAVQLEGCIAIGHGFDQVQPTGHALDDGITDSRREWKQLMALTAAADELELHVIDPIWRPGL
jgi:hypothetical protein